MSNNPRVRKYIYRICLSEERPLGKNVGDDDDAESQGGGERSWLTAGSVF